MAKSKRAITSPRRAPSRKPQIADRVDRAVDGRGRKATKPPGIEIEIPEEGVGSEAFWRDAIEAARQRTDKEVDVWKPLLESYAGEFPRQMTGFASTDEQINVNVGFYHTEQKIPNMFFQTPAIQVAPRRDDAREAAPVVQAVINQILGLDGIDAKSLVDEALRDCLIAAGFGPTKIGYRAVTRKLSMPTGRLVPQVDELTQLPAIDMNGQPVMVEAINADGTPETEEVERVIWDEIYWRRIAPENLLLPASLLSTRYDDAPWIGYRFFADRDQLAREYGVEAGTLADVNFDKLVLTPRDREAIQLQPVACGYEVWYRASYVDPDEPNPERIRRLVILETGTGRHGDAKTQIMVHGDSPYQTFKPTGEFEVGMKGFPIHPLCFRARPNTAFPASDCAVLKDVAREKNLSRTQMIQQRKRNLPMSGFNKNKLDVTVVAQIERGDVQSLIGFDGPVSDDDLRPLRNASFPPENFTFDRVNQQDIDRLGASGANNQGLGDTASDTATEASIIARATETRLANERNNVLGWLVRAASKILGLLQLTARDEHLVELVGPDGAKAFATWTRENIQGEFAFSVRPDSSVRLDAAQEREKVLKLYNLTANDPLMNHSEILKQVVEAFGYDPTKMVRVPPPPPEPPAPEPDKPRVSVAIKGEDLNPAMPQYTNVATLLTVAGIELQTAKPGPAPPGPPPPQRAAAPSVPVSKHVSNLTGKPVGRPV